jgi:hypothetical protein
MSTMRAGQVVSVKNDMLMGQCWNVASSMQAYKYHVILDSCHGNVMKPLHIT